MPTTDQGRTCPCYLHRTPPIEPIPCICECDHEGDDHARH